MCSRGIMSTRSGNIGLSPFDCAAFLCYQVIKKCLKMSFVNVLKIFCVTSAEKRKLEIAHRFKVLISVMISALHGMTTSLISGFMSCN